jgi:hypothetical protein
MVVQIGIPMFFIYLLYRYRVPTLARRKKRCHQLRRLLDTVDRESHGQMNELNAFLYSETSDDLTYAQMPTIVLEQVVSYLDLSVVAADVDTNGTLRDAAHRDSSHSTSSGD